MNRVHTAVPAEFRQTDYHEQQFDPTGEFRVDCKIGCGNQPLFIFAISDDEDCRKVVRSCLRFEQWGMRFSTLSVFKDQEKIGRRLLAQLSDVGGKQFSNLESNRDRIVKYLVDYLAEES